MTTGERKDPYLAFNFRVDIKNLSVGGFTEVTGLQVEIEVQDYREGGLNDYIHKLAGPARYPSNLVLKRGLIDIDALWDWYEAVIGGGNQRKIQRRNISIVLLNSLHEELRRWDFEQAYPVRWIGPELRAGTGAVAVETLELVHRGMRFGKR